ncbi:MAG: hypothetical protein Kow0047_23970 [Anaerolineae bacterium]
MTLLFCPHCGCYLPAGMACLACGRERSRVETPTAPGQPIWQARVPGAAAARLTLAHLDGRPVLAVPWGHLARRGDPRPTGGGVALLDVAEGTVIWEREVGLPVTGGAAVAGDVLVVAAGEPGFGGGRGRVIALDLRSGEERWAYDPGAAVRGVPVVDDVRVYFTADDGALHCLDVRNGQPVPPFPVAVTEAPVPLPASPVLMRRRGAAPAILVGTYGGQFGRVPGLVVAIDPQGRVLWRQPVGGNVRATPVLSEGALYVTAYFDHPSGGILTALDVRTGDPLWAEPFTIRAEPEARLRHYFSASPLVHEGVVYVGCLNRRLYAVDARTGKLLWGHPFPQGIATAPAWCQGLVIVGANDGRIYGLDPEKREIVWSYPLGDETQAQTAPLAWEDVIFAAAADGSVAALPWHLGEYAWAAERVEQTGRLVLAGELWALAGHFAVNAEAREEGYRRAAAAWLQAGEGERAGHMWLALGREREAAQAFRQAGEALRYRDPSRAAYAFKRAAELYVYGSFEEPEEVTACTRALCELLRLPFLHVQAINVPRYTQWQQGELLLRLFNRGRTPVSGIRLLLGGALERALEVTMEEPLPPEDGWTIPLTITPTRGRSTLVIEVTYDTGHAEVRRLRTAWAVTIEAAEPRQPPPRVEIGDVVHLTIAPATREGITLNVRDVGLIKSNRPFGQVNVEGDAGAISTSARDPRGLGDSESLPRQHHICSSCRHENPPEARYCEECGQHLVDSRNLKGPGGEEEGHAIA